jgi:hypothetical protein
MHARDWNRHLKSKKHIAITGIPCECGLYFSTSFNLKRHQEKCLREPPHVILIQLAREQAERDRVALEQAQRLAREQAERDRVALEYAKQQAESARVALEKTEQIAKIHSEHAELMEKQVGMLTEKMATLQCNVNNGTINNTFNLMFFLNDTCKDALTYQEFIESLPVGLPIDDKKLWEAIAEPLARLSVDKRPIHCTDLKRSKLVVKVTNTQTGEKKWEQNQEKTDTILLEMGAVLRHRYVTFVNEWCEKHPDFLDDEKLQEAWFKAAQFSNQSLIDGFKREVAKVTTIPKEDA